MQPPSPEVAARIAKNTEIGNDLVAHVNKGSTSDAPLWDRHFSPKFVSVEGDGMSCSGREKVQEKHDWWNGAMTVHSCKADGPFVTPTGFCVHFTMDVEAKDGSMPRSTMSEVGHYAVENGKVVREEFFGRPMEGHCEA